MDTLTLLRLQIEWGADEALDDAPVDRLRRSGRNPAGEQAGQAGTKLPLPLREEAGGRGGRPSPPDTAPQPPPSRGGGATADGPVHSAVGAAPSATQAERATAAAGGAQTLDELRAAIAAFDGCVLRDTAANLVFAAGSPDTGLLLIGEPPGEAEDRSGTPFAGPDGALLDRMLASIGLTRGEMLLAPLIPWRPPGGRPPSAAEIALCRPFLHRLVALAMPRRIVLAGILTARTLLGPTRRRAQPAWAELPIPGVASAIPVLTIPSPGALATTAAARKDAWAALRLLRRTLDQDAKI